MSDQNLFTLPLLNTVTHVSPIRSISFHSSAPVLVVCTYSGIAKVWRMSPDYKVANCMPDMMGVCAAFHPTEPLLAIGTKLNTVQIWRMQANGKGAVLTKILSGHNHWVVSVAFHPTEPMLATGSGDHTARLWRLSEDKYFFGTGAKSVVSKVVFHPNKPFFAICNGLVGEVYKVSYNYPHEYGPCQYYLTGHHGDVQSIAFHPTELIIATGSLDNSAKLWRMQEKGNQAVLMATLRGHSNIVTCVAFHPDGQFLVTTGSDTTVKVWLLNGDYSDATCVSTLQIGSKVTTLVFHPAGRFLATGSDDGAVKLWDCSLLTREGQSLQILATSSIAKTAAQGLSNLTTTHGNQQLWDKDAEHFQDIMMNRVKAKNPSLALGLLTDPQVRGEVIHEKKEKDKLKRGGKMSRRKYKNSNNKFNQRAIRKSKK